MTLAGVPPMFRFLCAAPLVAVAALALLPPGSSHSEPASEKKAEKQPVRKDFGLDKRVPWTTSKVKGSPEPPDPYQLVSTYPKLTFNEALEIAPVPGKRAWVVAERHGK